MEEPQQPPQVLSPESGVDDSGVVLLFYKYVVIADPDAHAEWQRGQCRRLHLTGKLRIAEEGINGTLGGTKEAIEAYQLEMQAHPLFSAADIQWKLSPGSAASFGELSVRVVKEIITLDVPGLTVDLAAKHLSPAEFHQALAQPSDDMVLIDCRNDYESQIGRFKGAVAPPVRKFSLFPKWVDDNLDTLQGKKVLMYCTGGIRCEKGSAYLRHKGLHEVYQLHGGIHKYIEQFPDGHFRGKNYVFDLRQSIAANGDVLSTCLFCSTPYDVYTTCASTDCYKLLLACEACQREREGKVYCCEECREMGPKWNKLVKAPKPRPGRAERRRRRMERRKAAALGAHDKAIPPDEDEDEEDARDDDILDHGVLAWGEEADE